VWKNTTITLSFVFLIIQSSIFLSNANATEQETNGSAYVVVLKDDVKNATTVSHELSSKYGILISHVYEYAFKGFSAEIPQDKLNELGNDSYVENMDPDIGVRVSDINADEQIGANKVWENGDAGNNIPVAILDTGIDITHPEFNGRIMACHSEFLKANSCEDDNGHGTHVAGILGSSGEIDINSKGVAPSSSLYIDKVLDADGSGSISKVIAGIDWAIQKHVKVISMSLGTSPIDTTEPNCDNEFHGLTKAINRAVKDGITVVAAAGNDGGAGVDAPACMGSVIAVGATDSMNVLAGFSSRGGPMADHGVVAPGMGIYSTWLGSGYQILSGTSMATPQVSGTISLMLSANPSLTPSEIKDILFNSTCNVASNSSCPTGNIPNQEYGYGRVDAFDAYNKVLVYSNSFVP